METIEITQEEYDDLWTDRRKLAALFHAGVDNWEWYEDAMAAFEDGEESLST